MIDISKYTLKELRDAVAAKESEARPQSLFKASFDAKLAIANWQKYNRDPSDEIVYQAEKLAQSCQSLVKTADDLIDSLKQIRYSMEIAGQTMQDLGACNAMEYCDDVSSIYDGIETLTAIIGDR